MCKGRHCAHDTDCFAAWPRLNIYELWDQYPNFWMHQIQGDSK